MLVVVEVQKFERTGHVSESESVPRVCNNMCILCDCVSRCECVCVLCVLLFLQKKARENPPNSKIPESGVRTLRRKFSGTGVSSQQNP